jgi:hypothetical protein
VGKYGSGQTANKERFRLFVIVRLTDDN